MIKHLKVDEQDKQNLPCGKLIQFYYNEDRFVALQEQLHLKNSSVENELFYSLNELYRKIVPKEKQAEISEKLYSSNTAEIEMESYILFHVRENGNDSYFANDFYKNFYTVANRYLQYIRKHSDCNFDLFAEALYCQKPLSASAFENLEKEKPKAMTNCICFDLDNKTVQILDDAHQSWQTYTLNEMLRAVFDANNSQLYELRPKLFFASLKEMKSEQKLNETDNDAILQM